MGGVAAGSAPPIRVGLEDRRERVGNGVSGEGPRGSQCFKQHATEGPDVDTLVERLAAHLLGAHIGSGAQNHPCLGAGDRQRGRLRQVDSGGVGLERLRQAEVENLGPFVGRDQHVRRLEIPMDDALPVSSLQGLRDLCAQGERRFDRQRPLGKPLR
jgi:hypothetical protein